MTPFKASRHPLGMLSCLAAAMCSLSLLLILEHAGLSVTDASVTDTVVARAVGRVAAGVVSRHANGMETDGIVALSAIFSLSVFMLHRTSSPERARETTWSRTQRMGSIACIAMLGVVPLPWMLAIGAIVPSARHVGGLTGDMALPLVVTAGWGIALVTVRLVYAAAGRGAGPSAKDGARIGEDARAAGVDRDRLDLDDMVRWSPSVEGPVTAAVRRGVDLAAALLLLVVVAPVMVVVAAVVAIDSPGPILYRQVRVGLNGAPFAILKFRSMRQDAERDGVARFAEIGDSRVTRVGHFLRLTRLDELPQLFNILAGSMSLVGPRPERPEFVERFRHSIPAYDLRHVVKPGLTGWAQVRYPYAATELETRGKLSYDLYYVRYRSMLLDLRIMLSTVRVMLTQSGAR